MKTEFLRKRLNREFESTVREDPEDYLLVHSFPGFWTVRALPPGIGSPELVEEYTQSRAIKEGVHLVLVRSGREFVHFHKDGSISRTLASYYNG